MVIDLGDIKKESLMQDSYVKKVYELACDKSLFYKSPEELRKKNGISRNDEYSLGNHKRTYGITTTI